MNNNDLNPGYNPPSDTVIGVPSSAAVLFSDIFGYIETVTVQPTFTPTNVYDQVKIYSGALYIWDSSTQTWHSYGSGGLNGFQVFTASGTFTKPAGFTKFMVEGIGGGAPGGNATSTGVGVVSAANGGGAGAYCRKLVDLSGVSTVSVTIGAASANTTFGAYFTAGGASNSTGGTATGGDLNINGANGESGMSVSQGGSNAAARGGKGAGSFFGDGGQAVVANTSQSNGNSASPFGAGGGGAASANGGTSATGGSGVGGAVLISW